MSGHPWGEFLEARAKCIDWMLNEGKTPDQIARELSMDGDQVLLIHLGRHQQMSTPTRQV